jgi:hypothetical protein
MDEPMIRDDAARSRIRQAEEFLDPRTHLVEPSFNTAIPSWLTISPQMINMCEATDQILS